ncbi:uncharacterized protein Dwil_GK28157 [Drosophila willistoni]|uniref:Uncharacterized protein n=1 Tax=Drosophila willistoni TaxID=7260 RepID=A0A0Q9X1N1_DROWI|nr:uncharacterized protein LOC26530159 [Drosophila willistoni]KRF99785.1 uncharacterized protein Dwil_GK28157 [Drosophila willistoni]
MFTKWISISIILLTIFCHTCRSLLWPASSNLGLTFSVSVPVSEFYPERRILTDWCFAVSYTYPSNLTSFYSIPIWPGFANYHAKRELPRLDHTEENFYTKYGHDLLSGLHPKDFSAGQLYGFLEDTLMDYGFHDTCLLRSVCELARHPFDDNHRHMFSDIITFVLSPTQHEGFLPTEHVYQKVYEQAESDGFLGKNCQQLYSMCRHDILTLISKVLVD